MFGCRSSEIFWKKTEFSNSRNFSEKVRKKVRILNKIVRQFQKNYVKFEFLSQKSLFLGQKVWKKFRKCSEKVQKMFRKVQKQGFPNIQKFWKLFYSEISENYKKNDVKLELRKLRKTRSDLKTDSKVWLKVRNAGP